MLAAMENSNNEHLKSLPGDTPTRSVDSVRSEEEVMRTLTAQIMEVRVALGRLALGNNAFACVIANGLESVFSGDDCPIKAMVSKSDIHGHALLAAFRIAGDIAIKMAGESIRMGLSVDMFKEKPPADPSAN